MYIAEIAPARSRGRLGVMYQLALSIGALVATVVAYFLAKYLPATTSWRWMFASVVVPVTFFAVLLMFVPQSPRWLAERNRFQEALDVLARTDPGESPQNRLDEIRGSLAQETGSFRELLQPGIRQAMFVGVILAVLNNWTGWSSIGYYLPTLFQRAGYHRAADAIGQNAIVMMGSVLFTFIASRLVDRAGRRPLWLAASGSMCFALILAGLIFQLNISGPAVILVLFLCMAPHAVGLGPLPWLMMSEIFPTRIRARAVAVATTFLWVAGFSGPFAFPTLESISEKTIGSNAGVFWLYAAICIFAFFWGLRFLPETRGRSLEEIAGSWLRIRGGWNGENGR
jgi:sugar porter (SP) family MFS transporter